MLLKKFTNFSIHKKALGSFNVWIVSKYSIPKEYNFGSRHFYFAKEFQALGVETLVITSDSNHLLHQKRPKLDKVFTFIYNDGKIPTIWIRAIKYSSASSFKRILSWLDFEIKLIILSFILKKPQNVIISSLPISSIITGFLLKIRGVRFLLEIRDIWPLTLIELGNFSKKNLLVKSLSFLEKLGYKYADEVIGTMPNLKEHLQNLGIERGVHCIPQGFNEIPRPTKLNKFQDLKDKFIVTYAGSIGLSNNLGTLFETINRLHENPNIFFFILGEGELFDHYKNNNININVCFTGKVSKLEVPNYLEISTVVYDSVMPRKIYKYGLSRNKWIDYMLAGKPLVVSYYGFKSMINESNCGFYVTANSSNELYELFIKLSEKSNKEHLKQLGLNGKTWLLENRNFAKLSSDYIKLLNYSKG